MYKNLLYILTKINKTNKHSKIFKHLHLIYIDSSLILNKLVDKFIMISALFVIIIMLFVLYYQSRN
jgi:hypothetical protein